MVAQRSHAWLLYAWLFTTLPFITALAPLPLSQRSDEVIELEMTKHRDKTEHSPYEHGLYTLQKMENLLNGNYEWWKAKLEAFKASKQTFNQTVKKYFTVSALNLYANKYQFIADIRYCRELVMIDSPHFDVCESIIILERAVNKIKLTRRSA